MGASMRDADVKYMRRALKLAAKGLGKTFPNPLVGAVIVNDGRIEGEGFHEGAGRPHAEVVAIRNAGEGAAGGSLYLNLEPCCHYGMTPPCTDAIIGAGIKRVVFGVYDPDERVGGNGARLLEKSGIEVRSGVLAEEATEINLPYLHRKMTGRAFIVLKLALTLDGKLTVEGKERITGDRSIRVVHRMRSALEAIAVGIGTIELDDPRLDRRFHPGKLEPPVRMVFDSTLKFPSDHRWLAAGERVIVFGAEGAPEERVKMLGRAGAEISLLRSSPNGIDLEAWVRDVAGRGIGSVLVEGGAKIATSLIRGGIVDRLVLFHAPLVSGAGGKDWFSDDSRPDWLESGEMILRKTGRLENDTISVYDRKRIAGYPGILAGDGFHVHGTG